MPMNHHARGLVKVRRFSLVFLLVALISSPSKVLVAQSMTFAGNNQHTGVFPAPAQRLERVRWRAPVDRSPGGAFAHYAAPLISPSNTVIVAQRLNGLGLYKIHAYEGSSGSLKYSLDCDRKLPSSIPWELTHQAVLAPRPHGLRLYYPGPGGTLFHVNNPDANNPGTPVQECFYTSLSNYLSDASNFNAHVSVNTPLTADSNGTIFFGFRVEGTAPAPLSTTYSGIARLDPDGNASFVLTDHISADSRCSR